MTLPTSPAPTLDRVLQHDLLVGVAIGVAAVAGFGPYFAAKMLPWNWFWQLAAGACGGGGLLFGLGALSKRSRKPFVDRLKRFYATAKPARSLSVRYKAMTLLEKIIANVLLVPAIIAAVFPFGLAIRVMHKSMGEPFTLAVTIIWMFAAVTLAFPVARLIKWSAVTIADQLSPRQ